jgi:O-antigen biosynthesis protein
VRTILISGAPAVQALVPLLSKQYDLCFIVGQNAQTAKQYGIQNVISIDELAGPLVAEHIWTEGARLVKKLDWQQTLRKFAPPLKDWFIGWALRQWVQHIVWIDQLEAVRSKVDVAGLIVHEDVTQQMMTSVRWAKLHGIPSLQVTHGTYGDPGQEIDMTLECRLHADYLSCCGPLQKEWFVENGVEPDRIRVNGMPLYDRWLLIPKDKQLARTQLRVPQDRHLIGYIASWCADYEDKSSLQRLEKVYRAYLEACKRNGWTIAVKVHPAGESNKQQNVEWHGKIAQELGVHGAISATNNEVFMQAVDCWISAVPSSFCTESAISMVPSTSIWGGLTDSGWPCIMSPEEDMVAQIECACKRMMTDEWKDEHEADRQKHVYGKNYLSDGRAAERVCRWVNEIMPEVKA